MSQSGRDRAYAKAEIAIKRISSILAGIAGAVVLWLFVLIFINVLLRYIFNYPFRHTDEILRFSMAWIVYLGFAYTLRSGGHISIDVVTIHLSQRPRKIFKTLSTLAVAIWILMINYGGWKLWLEMFIQKEHSFGLLEIELWIPGLCIIIGLSWFLVEAFADALRELLSLYNHNFDCEKSRKG